MKKNLYIDVHVLQTVPPSCVNRDDTGSPKTAIYGGTTRARVSSQAWKHAMRAMFRDEIFDVEKLGLRTKNVIEMVEKEIFAINPLADGKKLAKDVLTNAGVNIKSDKNKAEKAEALFFMSNAQAKALAQVAVNSLTATADEKKNYKKDCQNALNESPSIDIALFGRMVASAPLLNCDAAAQVAHSISTHTIQNEYDYFTAIDELAPEDASGAGHLGTNEFNSSTLYRYATVNLIELAGHLGKDATPEAARGFIDAFVRSMPTGKQNTFANRTLPSMVYVTLRRDQPVNLCGAFEKPVCAGKEGYAEKSEKQFIEYAEKMYANYATAPERAFGIGDAIGEISECMSFEKLLDAVSQVTAEYLNESEGI